MDTVILFEEYRFIERNEKEINSAWKSAHLLLFFLAFVFGSFCTFCFHMLMYIFDDKCVLFPKLLSLTSMQHVYEYIDSNKEITNVLPVDFVSTQWVDKSICYLPTFVPLVSGICGLIWTTMFLMCSTGNQTLTGLQRSWRVLPPVFVFSLAMGGLCIYSACITHSGLQALCLKLGELTNSTICTNAISVATLRYERRIHGVYQAIKLTIITSWLHTSCWILSAVFTLVRVIMAVDFQLIKVRAELQGDVDKMLERHERHIRTISPDVWLGDKDKDNSEPNGESIHTDIANIISENKRSKRATSLSALRRTPSDILYISKLHQDKSEMALVSSELNKLARLSAFETLSKEEHLVISLLYDLLEALEPDEYSEISETFSPRVEVNSNQLNLFRQKGQEAMRSKTTNSSDTLEDVKSVHQRTKDMQHTFQNIINNQLDEMSMTNSAAVMNSAESLSAIYDSSTYIDAEIRNILDFQLKIALDKSDRERMIKLRNESNSNIVAIKIKQSGHHHHRRVHITENKTTNSTGTQHDSEKSIVIDKETQILRKEKQD